MKPSPGLAVILLLQSCSHIPPLLRAATATATVASQVGTAPLDSDHPQPQLQRRFEASTISATEHDAKGGGKKKLAAAADKRVTTEGQCKRDAASSSHLPPWMRSGKPQICSWKDNDDSDYVYEYYHTDDDYAEYNAEYNKNAEELRQKVALEQISEGGPPPTLEQMKHARGCHRLPNAGRPLYTQKDWQRLRQIYINQGGAPIKIQDDEPADFVPPMRPGHTSDGKGRGVFATRDIKRGEMTYSGVKNYAFFNDGASYRRYIELLGDHEACDAMMWTWTQNTEWQLVILLIFDDNVLQNSGAGYQANTGPHPDYGGLFDEFALRDIQEGEELMCDYESFFGDFWGDFGL